jgi:hypothetical protein
MTDLEKARDAWTEHRTRLLGVMQRRLPGSVADVFNVLDLHIETVSKADDLLVALNERLKELVPLHVAYEQAADPDDFPEAGAAEAAELSAAVGRLLIDVGLDGVA